MTNTTDHHFGAFLEVKTRKTRKTELVWKCRNNHKKPRTQVYCDICGFAIDQHTETIKEYPNHQEVIDCVRSLNEACDTGIIALARFREMPDTFILYDTYSYWVDVDEEYWVDNAIYKYNINPFPTQAEISEMIDKFQSTYKQEIEDMKTLPSVVSVITKAGHVKNEEW